MKLIDQIDALIELLTPQGAWCQHSYAADHEDFQSPQSDEACMWCLMGGISRITGVGVMSGIESTALYMSIDAHLRGNAAYGLISWNDDKDRTQSQVIEMLKEVRGKVFAGEVNQVWSES